MLHCLIISEYYKQTAMSKTINPNKEDNVIQLVEAHNKYTETQLELMYAAEIVFGQKGINHTSHRDIINLTSQKNISAISYHFGGIDGLVRALLEIRMEVVDFERKKRFEKFIGNDDINNNILLDVYIDPLYEKCIDDIHWKNYIYFLQHLVTDYDRQFVNNLRQFSQVAFHIEKELKRINNIEDNHMWETRLANNAAFLTASLAFRRRELDNNKKVPSKKRYLSYLKSSVLSIFLKG